MKKISILILLISLLIAGMAEAQSFYSVRRDRSLIFTAGVNTSTYYGDLKDNRKFLDAKPSLSLGLMYYATKRIGVRGEFSWLTFSGDDSKSNTDGRVVRNLSFVSSNYEFNVSGLINFYEQRGRFYQRPAFNAYGFLGVGGLFFNPKAKLDGVKYALEPLHTEGHGYSRFTPIIPFGFGVKVKPSPFFDIALEAGWRKTFTDYIDDVSTRYVDNTSFTDPIAKQLADRGPEIGLALKAPGSKRGNPSSKDAYMLFSARIEYYLPYQFGGRGNKKLYRSKRRRAYSR